MCRIFTLGPTHRTSHSLPAYSTPKIIVVSRVRRRAGRGAKRISGMIRAPSAARFCGISAGAAAHLPTVRPAPLRNCATDARPSRPNGPARAANRVGHWFEFFAPCAFVQDSAAGVAAALYYPPICAAGHRKLFS